ncbi:MAG: hypothetical protein QM522_08820 [Chitinophagaceae bacterium]|jgi:chromosome segregation ATPase|nr:hypothetical protein [Chitinophagaceae bacterium]
MVNPLDDPIAVALAGLVLVLLARFTPLGLGLALLVALPLAPAIAALRARPHDRRVTAEIDAAEVRCRELAIQADLVRREALARFQDPAHLEPLGLVQLCCDRLRDLPERIASRRRLLQSGGGQLLSVQELEQRLQREHMAWRQESSATLRQERQRLVDQLRRNLEAARRGLDERQARLLALSTRLERIDGGLRHLQAQVARHWPSSDATDMAMTEAIAPLDQALDQIEQLLDDGRR